MGKELNILEVQKVIDRLKVLNVLKDCWKENPFAPSGDEITELQETITDMLNSYMDFLKEYQAGNLILKVDDTVGPANPASARRGKNAPAYKDSIDNDLIYKLWCAGESVNKIAKQAKCSPDSVKRRLAELQHGMEEG